MQTYCVRYIIIFCFPVLATMHVSEFLKLSLAGKYKETV